MGAPGCVCPRVLGQRQLPAQGPPPATAPGPSPQPRADSILKPMCTCLFPLPRSFPSWEVGCPHLTPHSLRVPTHLAFNTKLRSRRPGELGPEGGSPRTRVAQTSRVRNQACVCWGELGFASGTQPPNALKRAKMCPGSSTCALRHGARSRGIHTERRTRRAGRSPPSFCCDGTRPLHSDFIVQQVTWPSVTPRDRGVCASPGRAGNTPGQNKAGQGHTVLRPESPAGEGSAGPKCPPKKHPNLRELL